MEFLFVRNCLRNATFACLWMQKGGEIVYRTGADCNFAEAEVSIERCLQEQEVFASRPSSEEDQSHPQAPHEAPGTSIAIGFVYY